MPNLYEVGKKVSKCNKKSTCSNIPNHIISKEHHSLYEQHQDKQMLINNFFFIVITHHNYRERLPPHKQIFVRKICCWSAHRFVYGIGVVPQG